MSISVKNVVKALLTVALAIVFVSLAATWFKAHFVLGAYLGSEQAYEKLRFAAFCFVFLSALLSASASVDFGLRLMKTSFLLAAGRNRATNRTEIRGNGPE